MRASIRGILSWTLILCIWYVVHVMWHMPIRIRFDGGVGEISSAAEIIIVRGRIRIKRGEL